MDCGDLIVRDGRFYRTVALGGGLGLAEAYLHGYWDTPDLAAVLRVLAANLEVLTPSESTLARMWNRQRAWINWLRRNTRRGSKRNIAAHYDLSNDFFRLFLDPTMTYSAGWFDSPDASMEQASFAKYDRIARKLALSPEDHVLEIGTGWGGFAVHAAENYGCRVTTTTISEQQFKVAQQRAANSPASDRIEVLLRDYRDLEGQFDKLVSIEMIEAVGDRYLPQFFRQCCQLLRPGGLMCLQAILMPGQRFAAYRRGIDFIQRYVFPGGFLPSIGRIDECVGQATDLRWIGLEDMSPHYAETLRRWSAAFEQQIEQVRRLGFDDRFIRLWRYYLAYCEAGFATRQVTVAQLQFQRPTVTTIG
ncbi:MAG: cyclopropane-fatty-acyl-phospholipid synthase [Pirellulaceae bacterium]|nr:MAG: cyclopropane-fatty-acyl-phospholipid synthase [Pirellulaceae bacterium]